MNTCKDCLQNCDKIISDQCVQYTGPAIPLLGICTGDQITIYESNVATAILSALDGTGITPANITLANCLFLSQMLGALPPTLNNLLQLLVNADCTLNDMIVAIQNQIAAGQSGTVIDIRCLTGLPTTPTQSDILQAVIDLLCTTVATVAAIPSTYVSLADLVSLVTPIVNNIINGGSTTQFNSRMVPFVAVPYFGPLSNFDGDGIGLASQGFTRVFICNGGNGTPDMRGRAVVGAIRSVPGPSLDPAVDPAANPNNPNWGLNDKAGENFHLLTVPEMPSHVHVVDDPTHTHGVPRGDSYTGSSQAAANRTGGGQGTNPQTNVTTTPSLTGITLEPSGGSQPHINIQPSIAAYFIMYIP